MSRVDKVKDEAGLRAKYRAITLERIKQLKSQKEPAIPRPSYDKKERMLARMDELSNFTPPTFDVSKLWEKPGDPNTIEPDKLMVFYGKRRTGKTFAARDLLYQLRHYFPFGLVITKTGFNGQWREHFPDSYIHDDISVLSALKEKQIKDIEKVREQGLEDKVNLYKVVILDDIVDNDFRYINEVVNFATRGRHFKVCVFLLTQYPRLLASAVRSNTDYSFILFQKTGRERTAVAEELIPGLPPGTQGVELANLILDRFTQSTPEDPQRSILVTDGIKNVSDTRENLYLFEPKDPGPFLVGCPEFWQGDPRYYQR